MKLILINLVICLILCDITAKPASSPNLAILDAQLNDIRLSKSFFRAMPKFNPFDYKPLDVMQTVKVRSLDSPENAEKMLINSIDKDNGKSLTSTPNDSDSKFNSNSEDSRESSLSLSSSSSLEARNLRENKIYHHVQ